MVSAKEPAKFMSGETVAVNAFCKKGKLMVEFTPKNPINELGATGIYQLVLTNDETKYSKIILKFSADNSQDTFVSNTYVSGKPV